MEKFDKTGFGNEVAFSKEHRPWKFTLIDVASNRMDVLVQKLGKLACGVKVEVEAHWIKFSIGIPVFWEIRIAALVPKVLFPLKKYDKYASVIPSSFANSLRDKLFFFI